MVGNSRIGGWVVLVATVSILAATFFSLALARQVTPTAAQGSQPVDARETTGGEVTSGADESGADQLSDELLMLGGGPKEAPQDLPSKGYLVDTFIKGGIFMWPLLLCAIVGLAVILERAWTFHRAKVNARRLMSKVIGALRQEGLSGAIEVCRRTRGPIAAILWAGLTRAPKGTNAVEKAIENAGAIEVSFLQRGLIALTSIVNVAPMLGFLGTVSGMIHAFEAIAAAEQVSAKLVASGISEALITTEAGLVIAIPVQIAANYFISRIDGFILDMEETSVELADALAEMGREQMA